VLFGLGASGASGSALGDGASYDLRTGRWRHLTLPLALTDRDRAVDVAGVVVVRHAWQLTHYAPRRDVWSRMRLRSAALGPAGFRSEVGAPSPRGLRGPRRSRQASGSTSAAARSSYEVTVRGSDCPHREPNLSGARRRS
jgi:hypothetical protein